MKEATMTDDGERRAPVQGSPWLPPVLRGRYWLRPGTIPWAVHVRAWEAYAAAGHGAQSAECIAKRGGFDYYEIQCCLAGDYGMSGRLAPEEAALPPVPGWREIGGDDGQA